MIVIALLLAIVFVVLKLDPPNATDRTTPTGSASGDILVVLPEPDRVGLVSVESAISRRRSVRSYSDMALSLQAVSQLLWSAQGITDPVHGLRSAPSAGALYPLEVLVVAGAVDDLPAGVYRYQAAEHRLLLVKEGDYRAELYAVSLEQEAVRNAPLSLVITAIFSRTTATYGARGRTYVHMEAGHVGQNLSLQAVALDLGTVVIGAFNDKGLSAVLALGQDEEPLTILPVGYLPAN
jgi:SagB-type dehydrogenase family enzyme